MRLSQPTPMPPRHLSRVNVVLCIYGILGFVGLLIFKLSGHSNIYLSPTTTIHSSLWFGPLSGICVAGLFIALSTYANRKFTWAQKMSQHFRDVFGSTSHFEIFIIAFASSLGEELFFRGMLLPLFGLWPQALLFALLHIGPNRSFLPWTLSAFVMGLAFGAGTLFFGNLGFALIAHFTINFINLHIIIGTKSEAPSFSSKWQPLNKQGY